MDVPTTDGVQRAHARPVACVPVSASNPAAVPHHIRAE
jgi:hypothetical protein